MDTYITWVDIGFSEWFSIAPTMPTILDPEVPY
jgi:hypothetical protein